MAVEVGEDGVAGELSDSTASLVTAAADGSSRISGSSAAAATISSSSAAGAAVGEDVALHLTAALGRLEAVGAGGVEPGVSSEDAVTVTGGAADGGSPSSGTVGGPAPPPEVGSAEWREACPTLDRWGFELAAGGGGSQALVAAVRLENSRLAKWSRMLSLSSGQLPPRQKLPAATRRLLAKRVPKGVPDAVRGAVWCGLSGAQELMEDRPGAYAALKRRAAVEGSIPEVVASQIDNDLNRTYPDHFLWREEQAGAEGQPGGKSLGVQMLRSLLRTYALLDTEVTPHPDPNPNPNPHPTPNPNPNLNPAPAPNALHGTEVRRCRARLRCTACYLVITPTRCGTARQ